MRRLLALLLLLASPALADWGCLHPDRSLTDISSSRPACDGQVVPVVAILGSSLGPLAYDPNTQSAVPNQVALAAQAAADAARAADAAQLSGLSGAVAPDPNSAVGQALAALDAVQADVAAVQALPASPTTAQLRSAVLTLAGDVNRLATLQRKLLRQVARGVGQ